MSLFKRRRKVHVFEVMPGRWSASAGDSAGDVTWADGDSPEEAIEALRLLVQREDLRRAKTVEVGW